MEQNLVPITNEEVAKIEENVSQQFVIPDTEKEGILTEVNKMVDEVFSLDLSSAPKRLALIEKIDSLGEEVIKTTPNKDYSAIIISSSKLEKGETYTIYVGGTEIDTVTISNITTTVGNSSKMINNNGMMPNKMGR